MHKKVNPCSLCIQAVLNLFSLCYFWQTISQIVEVLDKLNKQCQEMESKYRAKITELRPKEERKKVKYCEPILISACNKFFQDVDRF